jgi:hypothetical protein
MKCEQGIVEVFFINARAVNFFGALVQFQGGAVEAHGRVTFGEGGGWYFRISEGHTAQLRRRLRSACSDIAELYNVDMFHRKYERVITYRDLTLMLCRKTTLEH